MTRREIGSDDPLEDVSGNARAPSDSYDSGRRLLASPLLHFLLVGLLLFCAVRWIASHSGAGDREIIEISSSQIDGARSEWIQRYKAIPTPAEERTLVDRMIDEELLYREALRIELDRNSPVVRNRLLQIAGLVGLKPNADEETRLAEARARGLDRNDPAIRSHLIGMMQSIYQRGDVPEEPTEDEVRAYVEQEPRRFMVPERIALSHIYLSADRRGESLDRDAAQLLARLRSDPISPEIAAEQGDVFMRGHAFPPQTPRQLTKIFGPGFAEAVMELKPGIWSGPLESAYGLHLVWVQKRVGEQLPEFVAIRGRARQELVASRGEEKLRARLDEVRGNYEIRVEEKSVPEVDATP